ncbi:MAG: gfo/Idh/MocA family oxidoreductase, partial [Oscillospiraceae bacterium]|nr:gfo/Idh/MocA family oxidoreductase [Oscillospiraceae bacterium]
HSVVLKKPGQEPKYFDVEQIQTNDNQTKSGIIDLWVDCLLKGEKSPISGESVLSAMRAVFASRESSGKGGAVDSPANR